MDNLNNLIEELYNLKQRKDYLKDKVSEIDKDISAKEFKILKLMEEQGVNTVKTGYGSATRKVEPYPSVDDIDTLVKWAYENNKPEILQRRISKSVFDEYYEQEGMYPEGVTVYNKETLSFRKARGS